MSEKETIYGSKMKYKGVFVYKDFYTFCYNWLRDETDMTIIAEKKYSEKISGNTKDIDIEWESNKKLTDYFKIIIKVKFKISKLKEVEVVQDGVKTKMNEADVEVDVKGILERDYDGKWEKDAFRKFLRGIYEKWVITSRINQFEDKVAGDSDEFLGQIKAYLALEGRR